MKPPVAKTAFGTADVDRHIEALVAQLGSREAIIRHLSHDDANAGSDRLPAGSVVRQISLSEPRKGRGFDILLRLDADELRRVEEQSDAVGCTRNQWVLSLIRKVLYGKTPAAKPQRHHISTIVNELRKIESNTTKAALSFAKLEAAAQDLSARLEPMDTLGARVKDITHALDAVFRGNEDYWQTLMDNLKRDTPRSAPKPKRPSRKRE